MRILALDAALGCCSAAVMGGDGRAVERASAGRFDQAARLPALAAAALAASGLRAADLDAVAVTVGPGSFTGLRAALALAEGLALAAGARLVGVTVVEALAAAAVPSPGRALWVALDARRPGRVYLATDGAAQTTLLTALPLPSGPVAILGDAAGVVAAWLAARGADVQLTDIRLPRAADVARVAQQRLLGALPPLPARPLYADAPPAPPRAAAG